MEPIHLRLEHEEQFGAWAEVGKPVGAVPPQVRTALEQDFPQADMGFWECTVGSFERQIMEAEYSYFISGSGCFTPTGGQAIAFKAGDSMYFAANTHGVWDIDETVRKTYVIFK